MVNHVSLVQTTEEDVVVDLQSKVSHNAKTALSVVDVVAAAEAAVAAMAVEEAVPLTEKETSEVVDPVV